MSDTPESLDQPSAELSRRVSVLMSEKAKMAGQMSAIYGYLDSVSVPKIGPLNKRVKLLVHLYREEKEKCARLQLLLDSEQEDDSDIDIEPLF